MRFCLLNAENRHPGDGKKYAEGYSVNTWASVTGGRLISGPLFDKGEYYLDYDYFDQFDLVMIALRSETIQAGLKVVERSKARVVAFIDGETDHFTSQIPRYLQSDMVRLLNLVDAVAVLHDQSIPLFRAMTGRPVGLVGLPFPLERVREMCPPAPKREQIELGSSVRSSFINNRNTLVNLAAMSEIGLPGVVDMLDPVEMEYIRSIKKCLPHLRIELRHSGQGWERYITRANYSLLGLHLDCSYTWGRFPVECAAVRMPCVAPPTLYTQKVLFPRLCVSHHDIGGVASLVKKLVSDRRFYEETVAYAQSQIELFSYEKCKKRLFDLIGQEVNL